MCRLYDAFIINANVKNGSILSLSAIDAKELSRLTAYSCIMTLMDILLVSLSREPHPLPFVYLTLYRHTVSILSIRATSGLLPPPSLSFWHT